MMHYSTSRLADFTADLVTQRAADHLVMKAIGERVVDPDDLPGWLRARGWNTKAAVPPTQMGDADLTSETAAFTGLVLRRSVLGRLEGAIRTTPAMDGGTRLLTQPVAAWVGEAVQKPVGTVTFGSGDLSPYKLVSQVVCSVEFVRRADLESVEILREALASGLGKGLDDAAFDPANAGTANVKPPSLTNGVTPVTSSSSAAAVAGAALAALDGAARPALVLSLASALQSSGLLADLREGGVQVLVSESAGPNIIALDAERVVLAIGDSMIESARHATMRLDTTPASGALTNLWSANLLAFKGEQYASWFAGVGAVAYGVVS